MESNHSDVLVICFCLGLFPLFGLMPLSESNNQAFKTKWKRILWLWFFFWATPGMFYLYTVAVMGG